MKIAKEGQWTYSTTDDVFYQAEYFDTKEEAIEAGKLDLKDYDTSFYVGQIQSVSINTTIDAEGILDDIAQNAYDEVGEVAEGYLEKVDVELRIELQKSIEEVVYAWIDKHNLRPDFFRVTNIEHIKNEEESETDESN